jgi:hypothetical protein
MAAVWAEDLTRESLWDAFWKRRIYAVTGDRIRMDFRLNGQPMGSLIEGQRGPRKIQIQMEGWDRFSHIDIIRNGRVVKTWSEFSSGTSEPPSRFKVPIRWYNSKDDVNISFEIQNGVLQGFNPHYTPPYYYILKQISATRLASSSSQEVRKTKGFLHNSVDLDIEGSLETIVSIRHLGNCILEKKLGEVLDQDFTIMPNGAYQGYYQIGRIIPESEFKRYMEWEDTMAESARDNYYVRAMQRNEQGCWSSPIWVG